MSSDSSSDLTSSSSSDCSTDSSDDEKLETVQVCGTRIQIPQGLCERKNIFQEFFSLNTWNSLSDNSRQHLNKFLPTFPRNDEQEKNNTVQRLFSGEVFKFSNPLSDFHDHLRAGHYRPDIAKMRYMIRKAERKEAKCRYRKFREQLESEVIESRQTLLNVVSALPPGVEPRLEKISTNTPAYISPVAYRTKTRYFQELSAVRSKVDESGFSSDENYPEGAPTPMSRKQKRHLNSIRNSHNLNGEKFLVSTMATKPNGLDLERNVTPNHNPFFITEDSYKQLLLNHKRRKVECPENPDLNTKGITLNEIIKRTKLTYVKKVSSSAPTTNSVKSQHHNDASNKLVHRKKLKKVDSHLYISPERITKPTPIFGHSSNSELESDSDSLIEPVLTTKKRKLTKKLDSKHETVNHFGISNTKRTSSPEKASSPNITNSVVKTSFTPYGKVTPATFSDLDGIDMMNLPIDLDDSNIDILDINNKPELMQETHSNFLSLIRDIICSTPEHRMNYKTLEERLKIWQENPITPLNDWYTHSDNWVGLLKSAVNFLSGISTEQPTDFVPYIEYKPQLRMYQWIGAGRDSDTLLSPLAEFWLEYRNEPKTAVPKEEREIEVELADRSQTPPPPRYPTGWVVRKADPEEIKSYREQERRRYDNPHKAFTFRSNGYASVVGPLKGIYNPSVGNAKARGHTMLSADRPNFVTILSLVRDATARLPNGEGTRADICELLKSSQYISSTAPDNVLQSVVSGALDRMHTQFDPCVKYDPKRKIWIYLHRNRSEEDFERIHQQYQSVTKTIKKANKNKTPNRSKQKSDRTNKSKGDTSPSPEKVKVLQKIKSNANQQQNISPTITNQNVVLLSSQDTSTNSPGSSKPGTSLLLPQINKLVKVEQTEISQAKVVSHQTVDEKEVSDALQMISQSNNAIKSSSSPKPGKSLVKIISPTQGKSLIIPSTSKLEQKSVGANKNQTITQHLLQTVGPQKFNSQQIRLELNDKIEQKIQSNKVPISIQQQLLQTISPQQLQNIKNVALLRNVSQRQSPQTIATTQAQTITISQNALNSQQMSLPKTSETGTQQIRVQQASLTPSQQQQILQSLKQKVLPIQSTVLAGQQQVILKHKGGVTQVSKQIQSVSGTSLLGQARHSAETISSKPILTSNQTPLVAKVLTNAAGQVISVESLLAHQKQHGSLPQDSAEDGNLVAEIRIQGFFTHRGGTTLRVSGVKGAQGSIIQLATPSKQNAVTQLTVGSQNNLIAITNQPKLVLSQAGTATTTTLTTTTKTTSKSMPKAQTVTKFTPKVAQQLINAKFITQNLDTQKIVQSKMIIGQNQVKLNAGKGMAANKPVSLGLTPNTNTIRMVNTANLNLTHIGGKPVLLASKGSSLQNLQGQNVIIQTQANTSGLVAINTTKPLTVSNVSQQSTSTVSLLNQQNAQVVLGPQLKMQQNSQMILSSGVKANMQSNPNVTQNQLVLGSHPVRLQTNSTTGAQRVVLASQGQGGQIVAQQILLPSGFQGTAINVKALQGVKVIPIAQSQQTKGVQSRQVFARVMAPSIVKTISSSSSSTDGSTTDSNTPTID